MMLISLRPAVQNKPLLLIHRDITNVNMLYSCLLSVTWHYYQFRWDKLQVLMQLVKPLFWPKSKWFYVGKNVALLCVTSSNFGQGCSVLFLHNIHAASRICVQDISPKGFEYRNAGEKNCCMSSFKSLDMMYLYAPVVLVIFQNEVDATVVL